MMKFTGTILLFVFVTYTAGLNAAEAVAVNEDTEVFAYIGARYQKAATLFAPQRFSLLEQDESTGMLRIDFGNDVGFIAQDTVSVMKSIGRSEPGAAYTKKSAVKKNRVLQGYIITVKPTALYTEHREAAPQFALIEADLRYPFIGQVTDSLGKRWYQVELADKTGYINAGDVQPDNGIPIVMYHHVLQDWENKNYRNTPTTVSTDALRFQFATMKTLGFSAINPEALERYLSGKINLPSKALVLTFDDGLKSVHRYAYPLLKEYGLTATLFVITSRIQQQPQEWAPDTLQFLSVREYQAMRDVTDLQSHTHSLHHYKNFKPAVLQTDYPTLYVDLTRSKQELAKLNAQTSYLAYPFGAYTSDFLTAAKKSGFTLGLTTQWGKVKFGDDPMLLKRVYFMSDADKARIAAVLGNESQ